MMAVSRVRAGFFVRHMFYQQFKCSVSAKFTQRRILENCHWDTPCFLKPVGINYINIYAALHKEKSKNQAKSKAKILKIDDNELSQYIDVTELRSQFQAEVDKLKQLYVTQLSIRSSIGFIESMKVEYEGKTYELQDLAQVAKKGPNVLAVNLGGFPQAAGAVMKALRSSALGLNPVQDSTLITVQLPRTTKEHRDNLAKQAKAAFVECKKMMDRLVDNQNKEVKNQEGISKDELIRINSLLRLVESEYLQTAESALKTKQDELKLDT